MIGKPRSKVGSEAGNLPVPTEKAVVRAAVKSRPIVARKARIHRGKKKKK